MIERLERGRTFQCGWVLTDDAGEAINADSTPTVARIFKNRVATVEAATVTDQTASETGCYALTFSPASPVAGDFYEIVIESTISSSIKPTKIQFVVTEKVGELQSILGTALTESSTGELAANFSKQPSDRNVSHWDWGNRDNHLSLPVLPNLTVSDAWSISAWVRCKGAIDVGSPTPRGMILEHSHDGATRIALRIDTNDDGKFVGVIYQVSGGFTSIWSQNNRDWDDGKWHHVVFTNDNRTLKLYVDGYDVGVAAAASAQALAAGGKIGLETTNSRKSIHHQTDTIVFNRVLTQQEAREITLRGPDADLSELAEAFTARWSPRYVNATIEQDRSGNGYNATWSSFDHAVYCLEEYPNAGIMESIHAVGNSLTVDAAMVHAGNLATWSINSGQDIQYAAANPTTAEANCIPWGTALADRRYRVLSLQPYPDSQTIADEVAAMQTIIDEFPAPGIILVYEGFAPSATVITGTEIDVADDGDVRHSTACMVEIVRQLQEANPGHVVIRSKTNEAVHLAYADIDGGTIDTGQILTLEFDTSANTSLYRDGVHMNYLVGRYLIHHCCRRALGITEKVRDYPLLTNPLYPSSTASLETLEWLDTVVDRVWPTTDTRVIDAAAINTEARLEKLDVAGTLANTDNADTFKADVSGIASQLAAGAVQRSPLNADGTTMDLTEGDAYSAADISWTVGTDYTSGYTGVLIISQRDDRAVVYKRHALAITNATTISIGADFEAAFDSALPFVGAPQIASVRFAAVMIETSSGDEVTIAQGRLNVKARGTTSA